MQNVCSQTLRMLYHLIIIKHTVELALGVSFRFMLDIIKKCM